MKFRRTALFIAFLLFPVTMWYFSPYLIVQALFREKPGIEPIPSDIGQ